ncbi:MAG: ketoacyl-ACP synthase III [Halorhodospira halophila]|uniref:beta-ketoacyl-ACP synthase III n=1 Tax=Halorhodospira TaxID=85108 RepID=UPI00191259F9|nr:beta-ketoacyl-ACP synthase III [Halorhodospira halophila]MBK5936868.1 3-oxoacyl-ACP synthase [Halorhodospira halophila]MBK5942313.1 3-oxoacyl-ACP synthase [Halorhodospira halophila]MCC3750346.1 ketoacyl-ACP synthase III [Halorhodospira halophila]MCG5537512.1 ketoacyl-ACP synthase III [Halorhodospira sp. 9622]
MSNARIIGTGSYLPERVITNKDLEQHVETSDQWIRERTGIGERRVIADEEVCGDLGRIAAQRALEAAGVSGDEIDLVIVATCTPDRIFPSTASSLQRALGVRPGAAAFDISAACSGFIYALGIAERFVRCGDARRALVIGAEAMTRILNWEDRGTCVLFGDGGGAVVLEASDEPGVLSTHLHCDGRYEPLLYVPWGPGRGYAALGAESGYIHMRGNEVFKVAVNTLTRIVEETLDSAGVDKGEVDWLVPHQANIRIIQATAKKLDLPMERVVVTVGEHGNTSAASIPIALDTAVRDGRIQRGETLLLEAFGGGFTWGSALVRY